MHTLTDCLQKAHYDGPAPFSNNSNNNLKKKIKRKNVYTQ